MASGDFFSSFRTITQVVTRTGFALARDCFTVRTCKEAASQFVSAARLFHGSYSQRECFTVRTRKENASRLVPDLLRRVMKPKSSVLRQSHSTLEPSPAHTKRIINTMPHHGPRIMKLRIRRINTSRNKPRYNPKTPQATVPVIRVVIRIAPIRLHPVDGNAQHIVLVSLRRAEAVMNSHELDTSCAVEA